MTASSRGGRASDPIYYLQIAATYLLVCAAAALFVAEMWGVGALLLVLAVALAIVRF